MKCITCNKALTGKYQKKYCNTSCAAKTTRLGNSYNRKSGRWAKKTCIICGAEHTAKKYCSTKCYSISRIKEMTSERREEIRVGNILKVRRYQARKLNQMPANVDVEKLKEIYKNCPNGYEVDHIIPLSKGGLHHPDNLQYLTSLENKQKGNKII